MKPLLKLFVILTLGATQLQAIVPLSEMSKSSLAIDYTGMWRGERITSSAVAAHENVQMAAIHYMPIPYLLITAGLGAAQFSVDEYNKLKFTGGWTIAPSFGVSGFSPKFFTMITGTAGIEGYYLYDPNKANTFLYQGAFTNFKAGLLFSFNDNVSLEIGEHDLVIFGEMGHVKDSASLYFSNKYNMRTYLSLLLTTPSENVYCSINFDASPKFGLDWSKGPQESSIGITLGFILRASTFKIKAADTQTEFPEFKGMEEKQHEMEKTVE